MVTFNRKQVRKAKESLTSATKSKILVANATTGASTAGAATGVELLKSLTVQLTDAGMSEKDMATLFQVNVREIKLLKKAMPATFVP